MKKVDRIFEEIGLSEKELLVYMGLINTQKGTASQVAKSANISRESAYYVLSSLEELGLVTKDPKKKVNTYLPSNPEKIIDLYEVRKNQIDAGRRLVQKKVNELEQLYNLTASGPGVSYFEGINGIKKMHESIFYAKKPKELLIFASRYDYVTLNSFLRDHIKKLTLNNIPQRLIVPDDMQISDRVGGMKLKREIKKVSKDKLDMPAEISISGNKVAIASFKKNKAAVLIENKDLANSLTQIFNYIWDI